MEHESTHTELVEKPQSEVAAIIADKLGETEQGPRNAIKRLVKALGRTQALALLDQTELVEANGGMMLPDGSRRRTIGGVYFHLAYTTGQPKEGKTLYRPKPPAKPQPAGDTKQATSKPAPAAQPPFQWDDRITAIGEITEKGQASTMKITLIGTLGKFVDKGTCVVGVMQASEKVPALPKGVPTPPPTRTNYTVYIGSKQWKTVAAAAVDTDDTLIIEGYPQIDAKTGSISVFATNVSSKKQMAAKREQQKTASSN